MSDTTRMAAKPEECSTRLAEIRARDAKFKLPMHPEYNTAAEHDRRWLLARVDALAGALRVLCAVLEDDDADVNDRAPIQGAYNMVDEALAALAETEGA